VEYITLQLLQGNQNGDETVSGFLNKYDFFIFPIVNPDGESRQPISTEE
jgi:murein tripeptide amidase MpaA